MGSSLLLSWEYLNRKVDNVVVRVEVEVIGTMVCKGRGEGHMDNGV